MTTTRRSSLNPGPPKRRKTGEDPRESEDDYRLRLSDYERNREPIPIVLEEINLNIPVKELQEDFTCPVCRNLLQQTMVTVECMHRFCYTCIREALFKGNKQCPACRRECHSMRNLRPDIRFDELIKVLYPAAVEKEEIQSLDSIIEANTSQLRKMYEEGMKRQMKIRRNRLARARPMSSRRSTSKHGSPELESDYDEDMGLSSDLDDVPQDIADDIDIDDTAPDVDELGDISDGDPPHLEDEVLIEEIVGREQPAWSVEITAIVHPSETRLPMGEVIRMRTTNECTLAHLTVVLREYYARQGDEFSELSNDDFSFSLTRPLHSNPLDLELSVSETRKKAGAGGVILLYHSLRRSRNRRRLD
ncbi:hypothetical protein DFS34DRAFT_658380 [Phlyctochytrium arcticum]|nr:hypothetical protein DFS34DRAFT_658380 [Phlyctochytrium arcticum]